MGLSSLNSAITGLSVAQKQISVISNNVANVGTEGYTRKILPQSTQVIDGVGVGVSPDTITRNVDMNLSKTLWTQISSTSRQSVQIDYLERIEQFHGSTQSENSISSEITDVYDKFAALADDPTNTLLMNQVVNEAQDLTSKINSFSDYITELRNNVEDDIAATVNEINSLLESIADINAQITTNINLGRTTAELEDARDANLKELSTRIEVTSYTRGDGAMIVQTNNGAELTGITAQELYFSASNLNADTFYPTTAGAITIGDPDLISSVNITDAAIGGKLEGLLTLRDETFPKQMAQLDEFAHKLATRFQAQGLTLFTDRNGLVPADTAPDLTTDPVGAVSYVGFSRDIQVNQVVLNDPTLLQKGTEDGGPTEIGSNTVINRILDYAFSNVEYQSAVGAIDLSVSDNLTGQTFLSNIDLNDPAWTNAADFMAANPSVTVANDTFRIVIEDPDLGIGPINIDVDISAIPDGAGNFGDDMIDHINTTLVPALTPAEQADLTTLGTTFSVSALGQLSIASNSNITIDTTAPANALTAAGVTAVGLDATTQASYDTLQDLLGLQSTNSIEGLQNLNDFTDPTSFITATGGAISATSGTFRVTFEEPSLGLGPVDVDIDLSAVVDTAGNLADDIISYINGTIIPGLTPGEQTALTEMNASFSVGANGQLVFDSNADITIDADAPLNPLGNANLGLLGLSDGTVTADDPYFDIAVGSNDFTRVYIEPNDTETSLLAKLNSIDGLAAQYAPTGELQLRPGNDFTNPDFGGSLRIVSGSFQTQNAGANTLFGANTVPDGLNVTSALFGTFSTGTPARDASPIQDSFYGSDISASDTNTLGFREDYLGPGANISTNIDSSASLLDFAQQIVAEHSQELTLLQTRYEDGETFQNLLENELLGNSGVNMDEELSNLIVVQTAYSAAARVISAVEELFDTLLGAF